MDLHLHAELLQVQHHVRSKVLVVVHGGQGEVALLVPRLVAQVVSALLGTGVPRPRHRIDVVVALVRVLVEPDRIEDVELALRTPVAHVGDARLQQVEFGLLGDASRVAAVHLARHRVLHEAVDDERGNPQERVDVGARGVGDQEHVGLLDLLEAADRGSVEPVAGLEPVLVELSDGDGEVLHQARQVAEPQVHDLRAPALGQIEDVFRCLRGLAHAWVSLPRRMGVSLARARRPEVSPALNLRFVLAQSAAGLA